MRVVATRVALNGVEQRLARWLPSVGAGTTRELPIDAPYQVGSIIHNRPNSINHIGRLKKVSPAIYTRAEAPHYSIQFNLTV